MDVDLSDVDWEEWERAGFFVPDSYKSSTAPDLESQVDTVMESSTGGDALEKPGCSSPTRELSEQEIIDEAFEFAVEFLNKHPQDSTSPKARH